MTGFTPLFIKSRDAANYQMNGAPDLKGLASPAQRIIEHGLR